MMLPKPSRSKRRTPELTLKQKDEIREQVWRDASGRCDKCGKSVMLLAGYWASMHLHHVQTRGAGGSWERSNLRCLCLGCHMDIHSGGKPCPPKERA